MIVDKFCNIRYYEKLLPNLEQGLRMIESMKEYEEGRYEFEGGYFLVQKGSTSPMEEGEFEVHRRYLDVQIILEGCEEVGWAYLDDLTTTKEYNPEKDAEFLKGSTDHPVTVTAGMFYAVFPKDGHMPCRHTEKPHEYKKIVMKLPL